MVSNNSCIIISEASSSKTAFFSYNIVLTENSKALEKNNWANFEVKTPGCKISKPLDKLSCTDVKGTYEIDKYAPNNSLAYYYNILLNDDIKDHMLNSNCSEFYWALLATGGMRNKVSIENQKEFYTSISKLFYGTTQVCKDQVCKNIYLKKAETISGKDEGYYVWLTLQNKHDHGCHISLDMGGESMQFSNGTKEGSLSWSLGKKALMEGIRELKYDLQPCYNDHNNVPYLVHYNGTLCRSLIDSYFDQNQYNFPTVTDTKYCNFYTISNFYLYFNDVCRTYLPHITKNDLPISEYTLNKINHLCGLWSTGASLSPFKISDYQNITDEVCAHWGVDWNAEVQPHFFARDACFAGNYNYMILKEFGLNDANIGKQIKIDPADWDYGAAKDLLDTCISFPQSDFNNDICNASSIISWVEKLWEMVF